VAQALKKHKIKGRKQLKKCRITVLKRTFHKDLVEEHSNFGPEHGPCPMLAEGQIFECGLDMPEGFCSWAWDDIHKIVLAALGGANFNNIVEDCTKDSNKCITCCTDGYRPVIFLLESFDA